MTHDPPSDAGLTRRRSVRTVVQSLFDQDVVMSDHGTRWAGLYAAIAAGGAVLVSPLLALSYFGTDEGADELEKRSVSAWADPTYDFVGGLLTWASPDRVYATYVQAFALLFPAVLICALAVRARKSAVGRTERCGWGIALFGYGLASVGLIAASFILFRGSTAGDALNVVFLALMLPGMAISVIGSTVLGIGLLRNSYTPRLTPWLLMAAFPSMLVLPDLLGHNSLGMLVVFVAWGATGWRLWRLESTDAHEPHAAATA